MRLYAFDSPEYLKVSRDVKHTIQAQGRRATYTSSRGPWAPKLTAKQNSVLLDYKKWRKRTLERTDQEWFDAIDATVEEKHHRAYVYQLLWWELCEQVPLDNNAWRARFVDFDYDRALNTDWPMMAYALHCCGLHPFIADRIATPCSDRTKWAANRKLEYQCPVCDKVSDSYEVEPRQCRLCYQHDKKMIRIS